MKKNFLRGSETCYMLPSQDKYKKVPDIPICCGKYRCPESVTFLLSPGQRISWEEEVFTPPRGGGGGRPVPEPQGVPREVRAVPKPFTHGFQEDKLRDMLVDTVARMQKDLAMLREENLVLRTPATSQVIQAPRRAALTTTKVPRFDGTTSWEQYHQVFEAIVRSNGWDNDTAALQLFSHLEGDALNVAHLVPLARRLSRSGLVDAVTFQRELIYQPNSSMLIIWPPHLHAR